MARLTQEQYQTMLARGMKPESIASLAKQKGYDLPDGKDFLQKATDIVTSIFPGGKVGESIGTAAGALYTKGKDILTGSKNFKQYDLSAPTPLQVGGDIAMGALSVAGPKVGLGKTAGSRILANTTLGAGIGASSAIAEGGDIKDVAKGAALGGAVTGGISVGTEGVRALMTNLPKWLTKVALPKLDNKNIPYAIENTKIGSINSLKTRSSASIGNYEDSIQSVLNHPEYKASVGGSPSILGKALEDFPNSNYTPDDLITNAKDMAPGVSKLINKFETNTANIQEINAIRKELDKATASVYTSLNRPPEKKLLGASLANSLRDFVQKNAPETEPIFSKYAQEVGLNKAIAAAIKKGEQKIKLGDIAAGAGGFAAGGWKGALQAILAERLLLNPSAQLAGAKILTGTNKITAPVAQAIIQGTKAPIAKKLGE